MREVRTGLVAATAEDAQQRQQVGEDVVHIQIDAQGGADVVGLAAVHDLLHVVQDVGREDGDGHYRDHDGQRWNAQEDVGNRGQQDHDQTGKRPARHAREIALGDGSDAGQHGEHGSGTAERRHDQEAAVGETQNARQQRGQPQAHEEGEAQQQGYAQTGILILFDAPDEAEGNAKEQQGHQTTAQRQVQRHAQRSAEDGRHHGQGQQPVGIAQHFVLDELATRRQVVSILHIIHELISLLVIRVLLAKSIACLCKIAQRSGVGALRLGLKRAGTG